MPSSSGFAATIDGASMADLVQLECMRGLTRAVRVTGDRGVGTLFFDQGQLVHAEVGETRGEAAALEILAWSGGKVEPSSSYWLKAPTILTSWQGLLLAAAQREDEEGPRSSRPPVPAVAPEKEPKSEMAETEDAEASSILRWVRLDAEGNTVKSGGDVGDFSDAVAYSVRLAQLIGDGLGLEEFRSFESTGAERNMLTYVEADGSTVALEVLSGAEIAAHRKKAGV